VRRPPTGDLLNLFPISAQGLEGPGPGPGDLDRRGRGLDRRDRGLGDLDRQGRVSGELHSPCEHLRGVDYVLGLRVGVAGPVGPAG
jgi:hypothetical protein